MELIVVGILFLLSQGAWLWFLDRRDKRKEHREWELMERIRQPERPLPPLEVIQNKPNPVFKEVAPKDEFDLVGQVNPKTPLREDD